ncbi:MAG: metal ABC transporter permease [Candidatus Sumerlaeaceae bacterium]|nr:metal ABC transporter permease [Candidatus Sumerlaeaceae bacterium]
MVGAGWDIVLADALSSPTLRVVGTGSAILGAVSGALGCFALLRRQSLVGDAVSHAALPGIALVFLLTGTKTSLGLLTGAALAGWLGMLFVQAIVRTTRLDDDTALGLVLAVFFGFGLMLLTFLQRKPKASQAGLDTYLFGQAATMLREDVVLLSCVGVVLIAIIALFWKEFILITFDREYASTVGYPVHRLEILLTVLLVGAITLGLRTVGVILMSAMIVAPAAAARQWTNRSHRMVGLAALFGAIAGASGAILSSLVPNLPTGPTIVLIATTWALASLLIGGRRGLVWQWLRRRVLQRKLAEEAVLIGLYDLALAHGDERRGHSEGAIRALSPHAVGVRGRLRRLKQEGMVEETSPGSWILSKKGRDEAKHLVEKSRETS